MRRIVSSCAVIAATATLAAPTVTAAAGEPSLVITSAPTSQVHFQKTYGGASVALRGVVNATSFSVTAGGGSDVAQLTVTGAIKTGVVSASRVALTAPGLGACVAHQAQAQVTITDFAVSFTAALRSTHATVHLTCLVQDPGGPKTAVIDATVTLPGSRTSVQELVPHTAPYTLLPAADGFNYGYTFTKGRFAYAVFWSGGRVRYHAPGNALWGGVAAGRGVIQSAQGTHSQLVLLDMHRGGVALRTPRGLNTNAWEWSPSVSGNQVFFNRGAQNATRKSIILFRIHQHSTWVVYTTTSPNVFVQAGSVSGQWAVWSLCIGNTCRIKVTNTATRQTRTEPLPAGVTDYSPTVVSNDVVYFVRSAPGCGNAVRVMRDDGISVRAVMTLPRGVSANELASTRLGGSDLVYYTKTVCSSQQRAVWRFTMPPSPGP